MSSSSESWLNEHPVSLLVIHKDLLNKFPILLPYHEFVLFLLESCTRFDDQTMALRLHQVNFCARSIATCVKLKIDTAHQSYLIEKVQDFLREHSDMVSLLNSDCLREEFEMYKN